MTRSSIFYQQHLWKQFIQRFQRKASERVKHRYNKRLDGKTRFAKNKPAAGYIRGPLRTRVRGGRIAGGSWFRGRRLPRVASALRQVACPEIRQRIKLNISQPLRAGSHFFEEQFPARIRMQVVQQSILGSGFSQPW